MFFTKENFYFDIDNLNQLRITGPQNHLFFGMGFPDDDKVVIDSYEIEKRQLVINMRLSKRTLISPIPIVTDIRTLRVYTENVRPQPTYGQLAEKNALELLPQNVKKQKRNGQIILRFTNFFTDERGKKRFYGSEIMLSNSYEADISDNKIAIRAGKPIKLTIKTVTNITFPQKLRTSIFTPNEFKADQFNKKLQTFYSNCGSSIDHLVRAQKTSSFEYGTIFPRDWVESADLGQGDFSTQTTDYMYKKAMMYISETGEGWHEEIVGSYRLKIDAKNIVDRKMIDIEPRYIIGMNFVSKRFLLRNENRRKFRLVANYILRNAEEKELITFKRAPDARDEYYMVGNWRDSNNAFPGQKSPLAPYDVNCVFYPVALKIIREYHTFFQIKDLEWLDNLIRKWDMNKQKYRLYHPYDTVGYAIALHGKKQKPLAVAHLDEAYDLFYGSPTLEEVVSFATKLTDPDFFYTPVGPIIVANDEEDYTTGQYHGKVIWPKQAAFAITGLSNQLRRGIVENWEENVLMAIKDSIIRTSEACFRGWEQLGVIPELYYYDAKENKARLYTDQEEYEGPMSLVQLWSLVGARRIMREYQFVKSTF